MDNHNIVNIADAKNEQSKMQKEFYTNSKTYFYRIIDKDRYTKIDNDLLQDGRLSFKARGIMAYFLSMPEDWKIFASEIVTHSPDGKDSFASGVKELEMYGYIVREKIKDERGKFVGICYRVIENPDRMWDSPENRLSDFGKAATINKRLNKPENPKISSIPGISYKHMFKKLTRAKKKNIPFENINWDTPIEKMEAKKIWDSIK